MNSIEIEYAADIALDAKKCVGDVDGGDDGDTAELEELERAEALAAAEDAAKEVADRGKQKKTHSV